jgi:hypothetical protein
MQERNNGRSRGGRTGGAMKTNPEQIQRVKEGQQRCNPLPCVFGPRPSFACFEASPSYYARQYQLPAPLRFAFFGPWRSPTLRIWRDRACRLATATNALGTPPRHQARMYQRFGETNTSALDSGEPVPAELGLSVAQAYCAPKSRGVPRDETWLPSTKAAEAGGQWVQVRGHAKGREARGRLNTGRCVAQSVFAARARRYHWTQTASRAPEPRYRQAFGL